jgi:hypothetical protein
MTREAFIKKWLANPQKQYNEQCRDEMRDDLDLVIETALRQPLVMRSFTACPSCGSDKIYFENWWTCRECTHDWGGK